MIEVALYFAGVFLAGMVSGAALMRMKKLRKPPEFVDSETVDETLYNEGYADGLFSAKAAIRTLAMLNYSYDHGQSLWHPIDPPLPQRPDTHL